MSAEEYEVLSSEEQHRLWELYIEQSKRQGFRPSLRDFMVWIQERA